MNKIFLLFLLSLFVSSCGNPHLTAPSEGPFPLASPILVDPNDKTCGTGIVVSDFRFFFNGDNKEFEEITKCRKTINEDFKVFEKEQVRVLTNHPRTQPSYGVVHKVQNSEHQDKVLYLEDIFNDQTYPLKVVQMGNDQGVDSLNSNQDSTDALLWSFESPVSFWSASLVDYHGGPAGRLMLFDCDEKLLEEVKLDGLKFIGFVSAEENVCHASITASDSFSSVKVDEFNYGL